MIFGKFWQSLIICLPFFNVWPLKKQDKDDFKPNLNLFLFLSRRNARATFWRYQPIFSKNIGCKTYSSLFSPFLCKNWLVQDKRSGTAILKINYWIFSQKIVNSFYKVLENVTISIFSHFLASNLFSHSTVRLNCKLFSLTKLHWDWPIKKLHGSHHCWMSWPALDKGNLFQPSSASTRESEKSWPGLWLPWLLRRLTWVAAETMRLSSHSDSFFVFMCCI